MLGLPSAQAAWLCPPARSRQARRQTGEVGSSPGRACPPRGQLPALTCRQSPPHAGDRLQARPGPTACDPRSVRLALRGSRSSRTPGRPGAAQLAARPRAGLRRRAMTRAAACPREPSAPAEARKAGAPPASGPKASSVASLITSTTRVKRRAGARCVGRPLQHGGGPPPVLRPGTRRLHRGPSCVVRPALARHGLHAGLVHSMARARVHGTVGSAPDVCLLGVRAAAHWRTALLGSGGRAAAIVPSSVRQPLMRMWQDVTRQGLAVSAAGHWQPC